MEEDDDDFYGGRTQSAEPTPVSEDGQAEVKDEQVDDNEEHEEEDEDEDVWRHFGSDWSGNIC